MEIITNLYKQKKGLENKIKELQQLKLDLSIKALELEQHEIKLKLEQKQLLKELDNNGQRTTQTYTQETSFKEETYFPSDPFTQ